MTTDIGPLAAALAKAQGAFPTVTRDKTVVVQKKTGGSYSFKYAPLDSILNAVRQPLAANGLVIVQLLDDGALVTSLIHESGAILSGRVDLPNTTDIQGLGSAITYLRRYAIQGMLGIAAEDDDDGNRASGNKVQEEPAPPPSVEESEGGLIGVVSIGKSAPVDGLLRETPEGMSVGFVIGEGREKVQVVAYGDLAGSLATLLPALVGQRVQVYGPVSMETMRVGNYDRKFPRLALIQLKHDDWTLPAKGEPETVPLFPDEPDEAEAAEIAEAERAEAALSA